MKPPVIEDMHRFRAIVWDKHNQEKQEKFIVIVSSKGWCIDDNSVYWSNYELIEEPTYRRFRDRDEFIQWLRDAGRTDMRVIDESGDMYTIIGVSEDGAFSEMLKSKWFDNGEPVGVKE